MTAAAEAVADKAGAESIPAGHKPAPARTFRRNRSAATLVRVAALVAQPVLLDRAAAETAQGQPAAFDVALRPRKQHRSATVIERIDEKTLQCAMLARAG
jgi:hypothetical protein